MSEMSRFCPAPDALAGWLEGTLSADRRAGVTAHLSACDDCRRATAVASSVENPPPIALDEAFLQRVVAASRRRPLWRWAAAAGVLSALALSFLLARSKTPIETVVIPRIDPPRAVVVADEPRVIEAKREEAVAPVPPPEPPKAPAATAQEEPKPAPPVAAEPSTPVPVVQRDPGRTEADLTNVFVPVYLMDPRGDLWIRREDAPPSRVRAFELAAPKDRLFAGSGGAGFTLEGRSTVVLEPGAEASLCFHKPDRSYAVELGKGVVMIDTEGSAQAWAVSRGAVKLAFNGLNGRLSLEPRGTQISALLMEGRAAIAVSGQTRAAEVGREVVVSQEGKPAMSRVDPKKKQARFNALRPPALTAFTATFDEKEAFAYSLAGGRVMRDGPLSWLHAEVEEYSGKTGVRAPVFAAVRPANPVASASRMVIRFRYRTTCPAIVVRLGAHVKVFNPEGAPGRWAEAELEFAAFEHEGVPLLPGEVIREVRFEAGPEKKSGDLDIDEVRFFKRAR